MRTFQTEVNQAIEELVAAVLSGKIKGKRDINKAIAKLKSKIDIPIYELKERLYEKAIEDAKKADTQAVKLLQASHLRAVINHLDEKQLKEVVDLLFKKPKIFTRINSKGEEVKYAVNMGEWLDNMGAGIADRAKKAIVAGFIAGDNPEDIARNIIGSKATDKYIRNQLKLIAETINYSVTENTNKAVFTKNSKYIKWLFYWTAEDDRVDDICVRHSKESKLNKYSPKEYPDYMIPPAHPRCRCKLLPMTKE